MADCATRKRLERLQGGNPYPRGVDSYYPSRGSNDSRTPMSDIQQGRVENTLYNSTDRNATKRKREEDGDRYGEGSSRKAPYGTSRRNDRDDRYTPPPRPRQIFERTETREEDLANQRITTRTTYRQNEYRDDNVGRFERRDVFREGRGGDARPARATRPEPPESVARQSLARRAMFNRQQSVNSMPLGNARGRASMTGVSDQNGIPSSTGGSAMQIDGESRPYSRTGLALPGRYLSKSQLKSGMIVRAVHSAVAQDKNADPAKNHNFVQTEVAILSAKRRAMAVDHFYAAGGWQGNPFYGADGDDQPHVKPEEMRYHLPVKMYNNDEYQSISDHHEPVNVTEIYDPSFVLKPAATINLQEACFFKDNEEFEVIGCLSKESTKIMMEKRMALEAEARNVSQSESEQRQDTTAPKAENEDEDEFTAMDATQLRKAARAPKVKIAEAEDDAAHYHERKNLYKASYEALLKK